MGGEQIALLAIVAVISAAGGYRMTRPTRQVRALILLYGTYQEPVMAEIPTLIEAKRIAQSNGYKWRETWKICGPDCDGEREILFRGVFEGNKRAKIPGEAEEDCYRVILRGEGTGYVLSGW
jgi:hypothetical protein